jgi:hypothetical protein
MWRPHEYDFDKLRDFALGKLSPEESLAILDQLEKDPELSSQFELVLALLDLSKEDWDKSRRGRN